MDDERDLLYSSGDPEELEQLKQILDQAPKTDLAFVPESYLLKDRVNLPFIRTSSGRRIVGLDEIRKYLLGEHAATR